MTNPSLQTNWTLMASHGVVLFYLAANPDSTMREMAEQLFLTERRIARIVRDLSDAGMIRIEKKGRRNSYRVDESAHFRHPTLSHLKLAAFVEALTGAKGLTDELAGEGRATRPHDID